MLDLKNEDKVLGGLDYRFKFIPKPDEEVSRFSKAALLISPSTRLGNQYPISSQKLLNFLKNCEGNSFPFSIMRLSILHLGGLFTDYFQISARLAGGPPLSRKIAESMALALEREWTEENTEILSAFKNEVIYSSDLLKNLEYKKIRYELKKFKKYPLFLTALAQCRDEFIARRHPGLEDTVKSLAKKHSLIRKKIFFHLDFFTLNLLAILLLCAKQGYQYILSTNTSHAYQNLMSLTLDMLSVESKPLHIIHIKCTRNKNVYHLKLPWSNIQKQEINWQISRLNKELSFSKLSKIEKILILQCLHSPDFYTQFFHQCIKLWNASLILKKNLSTEKRDYLENLKKSLSRVRTASDLVKTLILFQSKYWQFFFTLGVIEFFTLLPLLNPESTDFLEQCLINQSCLRKLYRMTGFLFLLNYQLNSTIKSGMILELLNFFKLTQDYDSSIMHEETKNFPITSTSPHLLTPKKTPKPSQVDSKQRLGNQFSPTNK